MAMFDVVAKGFRDVKNRFEGKRELTEENIEDALKDIRRAMLEADVNFRIAKGFINRVKESALGEVVKVRAKGKERVDITPGDAFIKICHDELEALMGPVDTSIIFANQRIGPTKIMMVGLQGSGKTTTTAKLAKLLIDEHGKKPLLVGCDVYRPAAIEQLRVLGDKLGVPVYAREEGDPVEVSIQALNVAKEKGCDTILFDTAGRLAVDDVLMDELEQIVKNVKPENIFLVVDAMIGQDAVNTASEFNERLEIDGFIMTKLDGDARGGAALSIKEVTGKPIKFVGIGEKLDDLEAFRPKGFANRILGFGDVIGLMNKFQKTLDEEEVERAEQESMRMLSGQFDFNDFYNQLENISKLGPMSDIFELLPFAGSISLPAGVLDDFELTRIRAIIQSMTVKERTQPDCLTRQPNRLRRIARGSGQELERVQRVLQQFNMMRGMMQQFSSVGGGFLSSIPGFKQLNQLRKMKNMDLGFLGELMGDSATQGGPLPGVPGRAFDLPPGYTPPGQNMARRRSSSAARPPKKRKRRVSRRSRQKDGGDE